MPYRCHPRSYKVCCVNASLGTFSATVSSGPTRYLPRSKSHDEGGSESPAAAGTVRGRIARQGARNARSRSPSTSPSRAQYTSPSASPTQGQTYVTKCDSIESLSNEENSALLKAEDKSKSESSLLIYFDGDDVQDTCV